MADINSSKLVLFPIDQSEQAKQAKAEHLLARDVYAKIGDMLERGLTRAIPAEDSDDLDEHRAHEAILLQGARGTGKSAILVNLELYLQQWRAGMVHKLLILKPIDPTLLEDGDELFLNIFIAALVRDKQIKSRLDRGGKEAEDFYDQLDRLASAIEGAQTQHDKQGMDKVRAVIGSASIAGHVHKLFQCILKLTRKRLIVMPIDDVDTALQHAFGTIEIVRKYLISPCTIAIISGDLELYADVIWRDFHGRLCDRSDAESDLAVLRAKKLSGEYQRKILPLPRRIEVPRLVAYLNDETVTLSDQGKPVISFPLFQLWLEAVLNERINGAENSFLFLPIDTVREFAQLVSHLYPLLSTLGKALDGELDGFRLRRRIFMREEIANAIEAFAKNYVSTRGQSAKSAREKDRKAAYDTLQARVKPQIPGVAPPFAKLAIEWQDLLLTYFQHHERGGPIFLALKANQHFRKCMNNLADRTASVFDAELFSPRAHEKYYQFSQSEEIKNEWQHHLSERIPNGFFKNLPKSSIVPYPRPELGRRITDSGKAIAESENLQGDDVEDAELVRRLMTHYNFYTSSSRTTLTLTGRILELLVTSLIRDVSVDGVLDIIDRPPFHSATAIARTKTFDFDGEDEPSIDGGDEDVAVGDTLSEWVEQINAWRKVNLAELESPPHAWLIYNVVNKYFNQVNYFNQADEPTPHLVAGSANKRPEGTRLDVFGTALQAFRAIWAIFGSFEKGQVFGFDEVIAYRNIGKADARFEQNQLYLQNIKPFLQRDSAATGEKPYFNFQTGAYTYLLASHPLKTKLERVYRNMIKEVGDTSAKAKTSSVETKPTGEQLTYAQANATLNPLIRKYSLKANEIEQMDLQASLKIFAEIKHALTALGAEDIIRIANDMERKSGGSALSKLHRLLVQIKILQDLRAEEASA